MHKGCPGEFADFFESDFEIRNVGLFLPQAYGRELSEAYEWLEKYKASRKEAELHQVRQRVSEV